jgi:uncharacterized protein (TIGR03000 family)
MRLLFPLFSLLLVAPTAVAGPPTSPRKGPPRELVAAPPLAPTPVLFPVWGNPWWGGFYGNPFYPGLFPQPQAVIVPQPVPVAPPPNPARLAEDAARAAATATANLTLELPAAGEVWVNDEKQPSSAEKARTLASPLLPLGREYTFKVRARWVEGNTAYETQQTSTVRAGERGKLTVYAGTLVK